MPVNLYDSKLHIQDIRNKSLLIILEKMVLLNIGNSNDFFLSDSNVQIFVACRKSV